MERKNRASYPALGGSSLLVIFAVLVLAVFMMLTLTTVQADRRLSDASIEAVSGYYAADLQAEEIFARLRSGELPAQVQVENGYYRYSCPISETQTLEVTLLRENDNWQILRWQAVANTASPSTEPLPVWDGNTALEETP